MSEPMHPRVIAATMRAKQFLISPVETDQAKAAAFAKSDELLMWSVRELLRAGRADLAHRVHSILEDMEADAFKRNVSNALRHSPAEIHPVEP
jgi:hypothetical protein